MLTTARARTTALTAAVDEADLVAQHSPLMSPLVWDLAHIGNQEELWLVRDVGGREPVRADIDELYDAFKHARPKPAVTSARCGRRCGTCSSAARCAAAGWSRTASPSA
ncbi:iron(II)-dependent oxidoreductase EgtB [Mycobacteroides abscessus subsp. abscessus]|nr:iron(II)-dependent oxidoreductase EgtB [Mycobacteroides abscessus subsp. abscessus]